VRHKDEGELTSFLKHRTLMDSHVGMNMGAVGFVCIWMCFQELKQALSREDEKRTFLSKKGKRMLVRREVEFKSIRCLQADA
jgi:NAD kinase